MTEGTRYEIFILEEDVPQEQREQGKVGRPRKFDSAMTRCTILMPPEWLRQIDTGSRIGVTRPAILRAIVRQALEANPEVVTGWGRQRLKE